MIIIIISSKFRTAKKELSIAIVTELTTLTIAIKGSITEDRKVQVLCQMIKRNKCSHNPNKPKIALKQAVQIQEKK